jgi:hypothetical protein
MQSNGQKIQYRKWNLFLLGFFAIGLFLIVLFVRDIPARMTYGDHGRIAIATLDEVQRPFLAIHATQSLLMNEGYSASAQQAFETAMQRGQILIAQYKQVVEYNPAVLTLVKGLDESFEAWMMKERVLFSLHKRAPGTSRNNTKHMAERHRLLAANSAGFSRTMKSLGNGEKPIHDDIHNGAQAVTELTMLGGLLMLMLLGSIFYLQWSRNKMLKDMLREVEQRVRERTTALKAANAELEAFSYSVSHDLRAPLRSIDGFSHALLESYADVMDDTGRGFLQRVRNNAQKMGDLIDAMLKLSHVNRHSIQQKPVALNELAKDIIQQLRELEPERQVDVTLTENISAIGDEHLLRIVLENLLGNAWKYTSKTEQAQIEFGSKQQNSEIAKRFITSQTTALVSTCNILTNCLAPFSDCMARNSRAPASV